jgi:hypothetical protein
MAAEVCGNLDVPVRYANQPAQRRHAPEASLTIDGWIRPTEVRQFCLCSAGTAASRGVVELRASS